jgi:hypothetical protein
VLIQAWRLTFYLVKPDQMLQSEIKQLSQLVVNYQPAIKRIHFAGNVGAQCPLADAQIGSQASMGHRLALKGGIDDLTEPLTTQVPLAHSFVGSRHRSTLNSGGAYSSMAASAPGAVKMRGSFRLPMPLEQDSTETRMWPFSEMWCQPAESQIQETILAQQVSQEEIDTAEEELIAAQEPEEMSAPEPELIEEPVGPVVKRAFG